MIPLERLGEYSNGIERFNIELSIKNKLSILDEVKDFINNYKPVIEDEGFNEDLLKINPLLHSI